MNFRIRALKSDFFAKFVQVSNASLIYYSIVACGIFLNLAYASLPPNFFHPDEIYQTLAVAHKLVYGYGFLSWEWKVGTFIVPGHRTGYGPIRSLITPLIFGSFFILGNILQLNYWNGTLFLIRMIMIINFIIGLYLASRILKMLNPDKNSYADKIFFVFALFYHDMIAYGSKTLTNTMVISLVFFALFIWLKDANKKKELTNENTLKKKWYHSIIKITYNDIIEFIGGICVGLAIWIRPDSAALMGVVVLLFIEKMNIKKILNFSVGFLLSAIFDGWLDLLYYGHFFETFPNFIAFNTKYQKLFGTEPFGWYFDQLVYHAFSFDYLYILMVLVLIILFVYFSYNFYSKKKFNSELAKEAFLLLRMFLWAALLLLWWELEPHKEIRFTILWEVVFLLAGTYNLALIIKYGKIIIEKLFLTQQQPLFKTLKRFHHKYPYALTVILLITVSLPFFNADAQEATKLSWNNFRDVMEATIWVGQQNVTGLGIAMPMWYAPGYAYLHKNVSMFMFGNANDLASLTSPVSLKFPPNVNVTFIPQILKYNHVINYLIIPTYRYSDVPHYKELLLQEGYKLVRTVYGTTDIYTI